MCEYMRVVTGDGELANSPSPSQFLGIYLTKMGCLPQKKNWETLLESNSDSTKLWMH